MLGALPADHFGGAGGHNDFRARATGYKVQLCREIDSTPAVINYYQHRALCASPQRVLQDLQLRAHRIFRTCEINPFVSATVSLLHTLDRPVSAHFCLQGIEPKAQAYYSRFNEVHPEMGEDDGGNTGLERVEYERKSCEEELACDHRHSLELEV